jgi:hypothetical protein
MLSNILTPLRDDVERLDRILALLGAESDHTARADLAEELMRECALLEDTKERALYPFLESAGFAEPTARLRASTEMLRSSMEPVYEAVHQTLPMYVHLQEEPGAFEHHVTELCVAIRTHRDHESPRIRVDRAAALKRARQHLDQRLRSERRRALQRPHPGHNSVTRLLERVLDGIERRLPDAGAQYRPARDKVAS